ncbi:MAG TPA: SDR family oxidoreductase [Anaerolineales bacterium]|jgi:2-deoxy-D-gluconate 3-dehydrogenase
MTIQDKFDLSGSVAVVTGGAGLLGTEFSRTLAEAGASVAVVDLNAAAAGPVVEALTRGGFRAQAFECDITDPDAVKRLAVSVLSTFGRLDILVNAAALDPKFDAAAVARGVTPGSFEDFPLQDWNAALNVNLTGMFLITQACVQPMLDQGKKGSIINICSTYGLNGPDQRIYIRDGKRVAYKPVYYSVTKAGVLGFTKYLSAYYAGSEIRVNALTPGGVFNEHDETFVKNYSSKTILGRMARKDEMNGALLFLACEASSYMTGGNLVVDGGWTAW